MSESFNSDVQLRAHNVCIKLTADQIEYLENFTHGKSSLAIEEAYQKLTGDLLEPVIARFWLSCRKIPLAYTKL